MCFSNDPRANNMPFARPVHDDDRAGDGAQRVFDKPRHVYVTCYLSFGRLGAASADTKINVLKKNKNPHGRPILFLSNRIFLVFLFFLFYFDLDRFSEVKKKTLTSYNSLETVRVLARHTRNTRTPYRYSRRFGRTGKNTNWKLLTPAPY